MRGTTYLSPFSAPYGGITVTKEADERDIKLLGSILHDWLIIIDGDCQITFPAPVINDSVVVSNNIFRDYLLTNGFKVEWVDYNYHINLSDSVFDSDIIRLFNRGNEAGYTLKVTGFDVEHIEKIYPVIYKNHIDLGYTVSMSLEDFIKTSSVVKMLLASVQNRHGDTIAGAILYFTRKSVMQLIMWGDDLSYRKSVGPMSFLGYSLIKFIKENVNEIKVLDLGPASKKGERSEGLIRFKKNLGALETEKYTLSWMRN